MSIGGAMQVLSVVSVCVVVCVWHAARSVDMQNAIMVYNVVWRTLVCVFVAKIYKF